MVSLVFGVIIFLKVTPYALSVKYYAYDMCSLLLTYFCLKLSLISVRRHYSSSGAQHRPVCGQLQCRNSRFRIRGVLPR